MTREPDAAPSHPPMPSQPPRPTLPEPPAPPEPGHGPPKWSWWVVGIVIPVFGLVVTLITQSGNNGSHGAPVTSPTTTQEQAAADPTETPTQTPADDVVTTLSPSPSPSKTTKILKTGDFTLLKGYSADLEHGTVGASVKNPDMAWNGSDEFSAMNGRVADTHEGATPKTCAEALDSPSSTGWMVSGLEGTWFCMPTSANHLAAVEWLGSGDGGIRYHYIVWDMTAPSGDD